MKNNIKAMVYVVVGITVATLSVFGIASMYFSETFVPVYVGNVYVISNQIVRYGIYAMLAVITILSAKLADYGTKYLIKRFHKIRRR